MEMEVSMLYAFNQVECPHTGQTEMVEVAVNPCSCLTGLKAQAVSCSERGDEARQCQSGCIDPKR